MTEGQDGSAPVAPTEAMPVETKDVAQGIQDANIASLEKSDPLEAGLQQPVKLAGLADKEQKVYGEKVEAPTAAPKQQIAPVSANGEQTSSRESMKNTDAPVSNVQESQSGTIPSSANDADSPTVPDNNQSEKESEPEISFEDLPPLEQANNLMQQIPGRFRLY